jgi:hypothetical protein
MSPILIDPRSPYGSKPTSDKSPKKFPRVVIGLGESPFATKAAAQLRALGWEVTTAASGEEARRLAVRGKAHALVLGLCGDLLATAKVVTALPKRTKVVLVGPTADPGQEQASTFLGAAFVAESDGVGGLVEAVRGAVRTACGC